MKLLRNIVVVIAVLALSGFARLSMDNKTAAELREQNLLPEPISLDTREALGQTGLAIALGGLRTLIASMLNLRALVHFENQEWHELENTYKTIVALQPHTRYYWEVAAWHLLSNAYADYYDRPEIPEGRRQRIQRSYFKKGIAFLERGVENNPDDWRLWAALAGAYSQMWRPNDLERAAEAYKTAFHLGGNLQVQRQHVYTLCRLPGREAEAWKFTQVMWDVVPNRTFTSPRSIYYAMQSWAAPPEAERVPLDQIYPNRRQALVDLCDYWFRQNQGYPVHGVREALVELCEEFGVPEELHPLRYETERAFRVSPVDGSPYEIDPRTGRAREVRWRTVWMDEIRPIFRKALRTRVN